MISPRDDDEFNVHSLDYDIIAHFKDENDLRIQWELDLVKAVIKRMTKLNDINAKGMDVVLHSDIPAGSGLGPLQQFVLLWLALWSAIIGFR